MYLEMCSEETCPQAYRNNKKPNVFSVCCCGWILFIFKDASKIEITRQTEASLWKVQPLPCAVVSQQLFSDLSE